eukprot:5526170-Heterocapsa_arctica.AAC.1
MARGHATLADVNASTLAAATAWPVEQEADLAAVLRKGVPAPRPGTGAFSAAFRALLAAALD